MEFISSALFISDQLAYYNPERLGTSILILVAVNSDRCAQFFGILVKKSLIFMYIVRIFNIYIIYSGY